MNLQEEYELSILKDFIDYAEDMDKRFECFKEFLKRAPKDEYFNYFENLFISDESLDIKLELLKYFRSSLDERYIQLVDNALITDKRLMREFLKCPPITVDKELRFFDDISSALELANTLCDLSYECIAYQRNLFSDEPDYWAPEEFTINSWKDREDYYSRLCEDDRIKIPFVYVPNYPNWRHKLCLLKRKRVIKRTIKKCKKDFKIIKGEVDQLKKYEQTYNKMIKGLLTAKIELGSIIKMKVEDNLFGRCRMPLPW